MPNQKDSEKKSAPPYVAFRTLTNFVEWLETEGIPQQIDRSFWGQRLSGAYGAQLVAALKFFKFVDEDNKPTDLLAKFVQNKDLRREMMASLLEKHYPDIYGLGLSNATPKQLRDAFNNYAITGPTLRKAQTFFLHAAAYAGIPLSSYITKSIKQRGGEGIKRTPRKTTATKKTSVPMTDSGGGTEQIHVDRYMESRPLLSVVLQQLPKDNAWSQADRTRWLKVFMEALDWDVKVGA